MKRGVCSIFKIFSTYIRGKKYIKCNIWRIAVRPSYVQDAGFLKVKKDNLQRIGNVLLQQNQQFQQETNRCPVVSVCAYFHLPETPCSSSSPYSVFNTLTVLREHTAWYCSQCQRNTLVSSTCCLKPTNGNSGACSVI